MVKDYSHKVLPFRVIYRRGNIQEREKEAALE
jgi:hypothetical protein